MVKRSFYFLVLSNQYCTVTHRSILGKPTQEDRYSFCEIHYAEATIVPDGIQKGYPLEINFELLETRIIQMKDELINIIHKRVKSYYWDLSLEICKEIGSKKARTPMAIMNRFEVLRVSNYFFLICKIYKIYI